MAKSAGFMAKLNGGEGRGTAGSARQGTSSRLNGRSEGQARGGRFGLYPRSIRSITDLLTPVRRTS